MRVPLPSIEELIVLMHGQDGGFVWLMSIEHLRGLQTINLCDGAGVPLYRRPVLSGYGTLLGHKIAISGFDYFGTAKI